MHRDYFTSRRKRDFLGKLIIKKKNLSILSLSVLKSKKKGNPQLLGEKRFYFPQLTNTFNDYVSKNEVEIDPHLFFIFWDDFFFFCIYFGVGKICWLSYHERVCVMFIYQFFFVIISSVACIWYLKLDCCIYCIWRIHFWFHVFMNIWELHNL